MTEPLHRSTIPKHASLYYFTLYLFYLNSHIALTNVHHLGLFETKSQDCYVDNYKYIDWY